MNLEAPLSNIFKNYFAKDVFSPNGKFCTGKLSISKECF